MSRRRIDFPITLALAVAAVLATALSAPALLAHAPALGRGELWRLVTGSFVHATAGHLARDVALLVIVGAAYEAPLGRRFGPMVIGLLIVPPLAVFAAERGIDTYYGLSGVTHGLIAAALVLELRSPSPARYARYVAIALTAKLAYEAATGAPAFAMDLGSNVRQVPAAHLAGAIIGALAALARASPSRVGSARSRFCPGPAGT